jgi:PAS domain S-box-containing protein
MRSSELRYRRLFEEANYGIVLADARTRKITQANPFVTDLLGMPHEEIVGREVKDLGVFGSPREYRAALQALDEKGEMRFDDVRLEDRHGRSHRVEVTARIHHEDLRAVVQWNLRDVTERRRAEEVRARLAAIVQSSDDAIVGKDLNGVITSWNAGAERLFGYTSEEAVGRSVTMLIPPDRLDEETSILGRLRAGERIDHFETIRRHKDGSLHDISLTVSPIVDSTGHIVGASKIARDVTERKRLEAALRKSVEDLRSRIRSERAARSEAERANHLKDEFVATLSHELRTPLNAILGWAQILQRTPAPNAPKEWEQGIGVIARSARDQAQLIADLLDMSGMLSGKVRLDARIMDLREPVEAALEAVHPAAEARGVRIVPRFEGPVVVYGDPNRLQQVVWNLLTNAVKFTPRDGAVQVSLVQNGSSCELTVRDTGKGISPDFLPHLFERFRQQDSGTQRQMRGLGLGLAIVKELVGLHGGSVSAASEGEGQGATFTVTLPVPAALTIGRAGSRTSSSAEPSEGTTLTVPFLNERRVLIVDDERSSRDVLQRILEERGAIVRAVGSADEGLAELDSFRPDVLTSDIGMPGRDGYEFIRLVRSRGSERGGAVPALALTAYARPEDSANSLKAGFQAHLAKPIDSAIFLATVSRLADSVPHA